MALKRRTSTAGLSIGQVLTLTLGFLVASLLIFLFGIWVGKDLVERRLAQEERVVRKPAERLTGESRGTDVDVTVTEPTPKQVAAANPTPSEPTARVTVRVATVTLTPGKSPTPVKVAVWPTSTPHGRHEAPPSTEPKPPQRTGAEWADAGWTVQVYATTEANQATALARRLLAKGYDAYTLQAPMRGQTWYRVRVGRFTSRERAKEMEQRLKTLEGMEAAYVTAQ